jgi:hypothetical protein
MKQLKQIQLRAKKRSFAAMVARAGVLVSRRWSSRHEPPPEASR